MKFPDERTERIYSATLDGGCDEVGDVQFGTHYTRVLDWTDPESNEANGFSHDGDYIVAEDTQGFVTLLGPFDDIDIEAGGYFNPSDRAWQECEATWSAFWDEA